jgi:hypothetical protein
MLEKDDAEMLVDLLQLYHAGEISSDWVEAKREQYATKIKALLVTV